MGEVIMKSEGYPGSLLSQLKDLYNSGQLCDFCLTTNKQEEVRLHSVVLFSASRFFKSLLQQGSLTDNKFCLQTGSLNTLKCIISFMYTGSLCLCENNYWLVLTLATQLDIPEAVDLCQRYLQNTGPLSSQACTDDIGYDVAFYDDDDDCDDDYHPNKSRLTKTLNKNSSSKCSHNSQKKRGRPRGSRNKKEVESGSSPTKMFLQVQQKVPLQKPDKCLSCPLCVKTFSWHIFLMHHKLKHFAQRYFRIKSNFLLWQSHHKGKRDQSQCLRCGNTFKSSSYLKAHTIRHHPGLMTFSCWQCPRLKFHTKMLLLLHYCHNHPKRRPSQLSHQCPYCRQLFLHRRNLLFHQKKVHGILKSIRSQLGSRRDSPKARVSRKWICEEKECTGRTFRCSDELNKHMLMVHPHVDYSCPECRFTTRIKQLLQRHKTKMHGNRQSVICEFCGKAFPKHSRLKLHLFSKHKVKDPSLKVYQCTVEGCKYSCVIKDGLRRHMLSHQSEKPFSCTICDKPFKTKKSMEKHTRKIHLGIRDYVCDVCGQAYGEESDLKIHMARHSSVKPYICQYCDYSTYDKGNYKTHLYGKHGLKLEENMKIFECTICDFKTSTKYRFSDHMRVHKQVRDIPCPHCNKLFMTRKAMGGHVMKVHRPKDLRCDNCTYVTSDKTKLKEHVRIMHTHRNLKPYKCPYCSFQCATGGNCRKHVIHKHKGREVTYEKLDGCQAMIREEVQQPMPDSLLIQNPDQAFSGSVYEQSQYRSDGQVGSSTVSVLDNQAIEDSVRVITPYNESVAMNWYPFNAMLPQTDHQLPAFR